MIIHPFDLTSFALGLLLPFAVYGLITVWSNHRAVKAKRKPAAA
jgi:hypothetical protein